MEFVTSFGKFGVRLTAKLWTKVSSERVVVERERERKREKESGCEREWWGMAEGREL